MPRQGSWATGACLTRLTSVRVRVRLGPRLVIDIQRVVGMTNYYAERQTFKSFETYVVSEHFGMQFISTTVLVSHRLAEWSTLEAGMLFW